MYSAPIFRQTDEARLTALVAERGFAVIAVAHEGRPLVAQAPVLLAGRRLRFHLARGNPVVAALTAGAPAVVVVQGPDAYVSPDWYGIDDQVPTWNYLAVEMEGRAQVLDEAGAAQLLDDLSAHFESRLTPKPPWTRRKISPGRFEAMQRAIVSFELAVERLEGVWKLSQNKPAGVTARAAEAMAERPEDGSRAIAALMAKL